VTPGRETAFEGKSLERSNASRVGSGGGRVRVRLREGGLSLKEGEVKMQEGGV
jgi:hypothetical protein